MKKGITITYALRTNPMQYAFLNHEMEKTLQMYEDLLLQKQRCQFRFDINAHCKGYAKHYLPAMSALELRCMHRQLMHDHYPYQCQGVVDKRLIWRGIHLYPMMSMPYPWMREPIYRHLRIVDSKLLNRGRILYLTILFDYEERNMV